MYDYIYCLYVGFNYKHVDISVRTQGIKFWPHKFGIYIYIYIYICMYICIYLYIYICVCVCVRVCDIFTT